MWSGSIWEARTLAEDSWGTRKRGQQERRVFAEGDSVYLARIKGSAIDGYSQRVYSPFALNPVIPKLIHRLLNSLGRRSTIPMGSKPERALPGAASYRCVSSGGTCTRVT